MMNYLRTMPALLVLLRHPKAGCVKTRLAAAIGSAKAAALYSEWIGIVLSNVGALRGRVRIVGFFDGASAEVFARWSCFVDEWWPQPGGDLGIRLAAGFDRAHTQCSPVVAIGTDCLDVDVAIIEEAIACLSNHDAVFGPSIDGGYYLVGTGRPISDFFANVPWSSPETLRVHQSRCQRRGWTFSTLAYRRDIDTVEDWEAHCENAANI